MDLQILFFGFALIVLFYLIDFKVISPSRLRKRDIIDKLEKNRARDLAFLQEIETVITENDAWTLNALPGQDITFEEYIGAIKEKYAIEYAAAEFDRLKLTQLDARQLLDYIDKINSQDDAIELYRMDFDTRLGALQLNRAS